MCTVKTDERERGMPSKFDAERVYFPRILIVDHHDSYTHNLLISLLNAIVPHDAPNAHRTACSSILLERTLILPHTDPLWQDEKFVKTHLLPNFDALILSPGPGRPEIEKDFGASHRILKLLLNTGQSSCQDNYMAYEDDQVIPIPTLGICLGHQGIAHALGASIKRAQYLRHGLCSEVVPTSSTGDARWPDLLQNVGAGCLATTYNSLVVDEDSLPKELVVTAVANDGSINGGTEVETREKERIVMAIQHRTLPVWGVQFHPESIASQHGDRIMQNFISNVRCFWRQEAAVANENSALASGARRRLQAWKADLSLPVWLQHRDGICRRRFSIHPSSSVKAQGKRFRVHSTHLGKFDARVAPTVFKRVMATGADTTGSAAWLDSARSDGKYGRFSFMALPSWQIEYEVSTKCVSIDVDGKRSCCTLHNHSQSHWGSEYMANDTRPSTVETTYGLPTPNASRTHSPETLGNLQNGNEYPGHGFWTWFDAVQKALQEQSDASHIDSAPFLTGFVGYFGYDLKNESLPSSEGRRSTSEPNSSFPSAWFGFCDKLLAIDHLTNDWFAYGLLQNQASLPSKRDTADTRLHFIESALSKADRRMGCSMEEYSRWTAQAKTCLVEAASNSCCIDTSNTTPTAFPYISPVDNAVEYKAKVERARDLIAAGESYELCLTTEFRGTLLPLSPPEAEADNQRHFDMYVDLRRRNPAPFSSFVKLNTRQSILCTSPEKFFGMDAGGQVEMKPIKGTLARAGYAKGEEEIGKRAREGDASSIQWCAEQDEMRKASLKADAKERAENLMIVDLIRRDLLHFCPPESVCVPSLMAIETYATVHQMVTTVHGRKRDQLSSLSSSSPSSPSSNFNNVGTVAALSHCFPPGSMTGAPKVRSVALLEQLERRSDRKSRGVYSGTLGWLGIDGAANFNVVIRTVCIDGAQVSVGAGGAITYHSNADGEWQEVLDKVGAIAKVTL